MKTTDYLDLLNNCRDGAVKYINTLKTSKWEFKVSKEADTPIAIASATAAILSGFLGTIADFSDQEKKEWINYLQSFQCEDGLFIDSVDIEQQTQKQPSWALIAHRTRHMAWAIETLGGSIKYPISFIGPHASPEGITKWLDELWGQNWPGGIWAAGNWIMDMGVLLDLQYRHFNDNIALETLMTLLKELDKKQDTDTGFWFGPGDDLRCAMAGSMHLYPLYWAYGKKLNYFDKAVESTLQLQQKDGLFGYEIGIGGSQCLDFDAMLILANGYHALPSKRGAIKESCKKVMDSIMVNGNSDGSFADCQINEIRHWATKAATFKANGGSLWDTYARIMTIAMCIEILTGQLPSMIQGEHHLFEIWHGGNGWNNGTYKK